MAEESHLRLECEPPLPVFPRDFVDTSVAQSYWKSDPRDQSWQRIRRLYEGGWGRVALDRPSQKKGMSYDDFCSLVATQQNSCQGGAAVEEESSDTINESFAKKSIIMVRNAFGQPFIDVVTGCCGGHVPCAGGEYLHKGREQQKKRRKCRPWNQVVSAPQLSQTDRESIGGLCRQMLSSLSLPGVLLCHIQIVEKGSLGVGDEILSQNLEHGQGERIVLGRVTAGGFSSSRGKCHGVGILGAARLLDYLVCCTDHASTGRMSCGKIVRQRSGKILYHLSVAIKNAAITAIPREACLSLMIYI
jgi:hypothetical protein